MQPRTPDRRMYAPPAAKWWETPELTQVNMLPMTACLAPFPSPAEALTNDRFASPWVRSLNGIWRFKRYPRPEDVSEHTLRDEHESELFRDMPVPSNWTLEDTEDKPIYTNSRMPFDNNPPLVPEDNPTAIYRTAFDVPDQWSGRRVVIHFGGVESYYEFFVNGTFAGMAKDTRLPSEFDITQLVVPGANRLSVKVLRWCDGSYIEDQDQWWMAGIYREVYLYSTAPALIEDVFVRAEYNADTCTGLLEVDATFAYVPVDPDDPWTESGPLADHILDATLYQPDGTPMWTSRNQIDPSFRIRAYQERISAEFPGIDPWSSERPTLYQLVLTLSDADGATIECRSVRLGFRSIRISNRELLINGKAVLIRGVNRHEHDERTGKSISRELMLADIRTLKQFNFNAVRNSHYPNVEEWYDLCDEYGIYLVDEANIEAHANYHSICRNPRWGRAFEERIMNMVRRDKNHPCVIAWSAGNESGHGENHVRALDQVRAFDPTRVVHHEGEVKHTWAKGVDAYVGGLNRYNDLANPMYPTVASIIDHAVNGQDPRPMILCEYSHAMGNSNGSLAEYWDAFERYHGLQGGFIWEWADQCIVKVDERGREYWAYGGDFGETIHDGNFVADGLVASDRTPHPAMWEFKKLAQPLEVVEVSVTEGRFILTNKQDFTSLGWLKGSWELRVEGVVKDAGELPPLVTPAGGSQLIQIEYADGTLLDVADAHVFFSFATHSATPWCGAGHEVAWEEFRANNQRLSTPTRAHTKRPNTQDHCGVVEVDSNLVLTSGALTVRVPDTQEIGAHAGRMTLVHAGSEIIRHGPRLNLFRAPTDNDGIRGWDKQEHKPMGQWIAAGFNELALVDRTVNVGTTVPVAGVACSPTITELARYVGSDRHSVISYTQNTVLLSESIVHIEVTIEVPTSLPTLPRVGVILETAPGFETLRWYGRGPHENHIDRKAGSPVGQYSGAVADQYVAYAMPQENGNKCDVRWFELSDGVHCVRFIADPIFEFSAHHFTPQDIFACRHTLDVLDALREETVVCIDHRQRGVGTGSCGPQTLDQYCISPGTHSFGYWIQVGTCT